MRNEAGFSEIQWLVMCLRAAGGYSVKDTASLLRNKPNDVRHIYGRAKNRAVEWRKGKVPNNTCKATNLPEIDEVLEAAAQGRPVQRSQDKGQNYVSDAGHDGKPDRTGHYPGGRPPKIGESLKTRRPILGNIIFGLDEGGLLIAPTQRRIITNVFDDILPPSENLVKRNKVIGSRLTSGEKEFRRVVDLVLLNNDQIGEYGQNDQALWRTVREHPIFSTFDRAQMLQFVKRDFNNFVLRADQKGTVVEGVIQKWRGEVLEAARMDETEILEKTENKDFYERQVEIARASSELLPTGARLYPTKDSVIRAVYGADVDPRDRQGFMYHSLRAISLKLQNTFISRLRPNMDAFLDSLRSNPFYGPDVNPNDVAGVILNRYSVDQYGRAVFDLNADPRTNQRRLREMALEARANSEQALHAY